MSGMKIFLLMFLGFLIGYCSTTAEDLELQKYREQEKEMRR
jgi:hypothetical protein